MSHVFVIVGILELANCVNLQTADNGNSVGVYKLHCPKKARSHKAQFGPKYVFGDPISTKTFIPLMAPPLNGDIQFKSVQEMTLEPE